MLTCVDLSRSAQMQFCGGGTLEDFLARPDRTVDCAHNLLLFEQMVQGLAHVHEQGLIHRDLKPQNIFMTSSKDLRIGDFGLSKDSMTSTEGEGLALRPFCPLSLFVHGDLLCAECTARSSRCARGSQPPQR